MTRQQIILCALGAFAGLLGLPGAASSNDYTVGRWVWAGQSPDARRSSEQLYVYQGIFRAEGLPRYEFRGPKPRLMKGDKTPIVLTYRLQALVPPGMVEARYRAHAQAWRRRGSNVAGLQIDYDCPTARLPEYARWLEALGRQIEGGAELSITGLGDWLVSAQPNHLKNLSQQAAFIAFMMYHGRKALDPIEPFAVALARANFPFKLGLFQNQSSWPQLRKVRDAPGYRGDIFFVIGKEDE